MELFEVRGSDEGTPGGCDQGFEGLPEIGLQSENNQGDYTIVIHFRLVTLESNLSKINHRAKLWSLEFFYFSQK